MLPPNSAEHPVVDRRRGLRPRAAGRRRCAAASRRRRRAGARGAGVLDRELAEALDQRSHHRVGRGELGVRRSRCVTLSRTLSCAPRRQPAATCIAGRRCLDAQGHAPRSARMQVRHACTCADRFDPTAGRGSPWPSPRCSCSPAAIALALGVGAAGRARGQGAGVGGEAEHRRPAHRRPGVALDAGDEDRRQGAEAQGRDDEALLRQLPALLPVAGDDPHRPVRAQPRRALELAARTAATASSTSSTATTTCRSGCRRPATRPPTSASS